MGVSVFFLLKKENLKRKLANLDYKLYYLHFNLSAGRRMVTTVVLMLLAFDPSFYFNVVDISQY